MDAQDITNDQQDDILNQDFTDLIEIFKAKLLIDLNLDKASEEDKNETLAKISELTDNRIINLIMIYLPEDKVEEFAALTDKEELNSDEVGEFLYSNIPSFSDKVIIELSSIRNELIDKMEKYKKDATK